MHLKYDSTVVILQWRHRLRIGEWQINADYSESTARADLQSIRKQFVAGSSHYFRKIALQRNSRAYSFRPYKNVQS